MHLENRMSILKSIFQYILIKQRNRAFFALYGDSPLDKEPAGENVYMNLLRHAKKYIYFTTPYLILSDEMTRELTGAAKRGVDVRIITPGIPDKKTIFQVTKSYYPQLLKHGVKIYEYTPGFMHESNVSAMERLL